jgi:restriction system protein
VAHNAMSWQEFEMLVGEAFRVQGFQVTEQGGATADGGVDVVLRKGTETWLVQCKQWKAFKVDVKVVRELYGVMAARGAAGGYVITSGRYTADARSFAEGRVKLIDGDELFALIQQGKTSRHERSTQVKSTAAPTSAAETTPRCPTCAAAMVRRTAKKGSNAGSQFWGCSTYPACRGTR